MNQDIKFVQKMGQKYGNIFWRELNVEAMGLKVWSKRADLHIVFGKNYAVSAVATCDPQFITKSKQIGSGEGEKRR